MEPIARVRRVTEHPLFTMFKNTGATEREGHYLSDQNLQIVECQITILLKSIYNFFAENFYNFLSLLDGDRMLINSDWW